MGNIFFFHVILKTSALLKTHPLFYFTDKYTIIPAKEKHKK